MSSWLTELSLGVDSVSVVDRLTFLAILYLGIGDLELRFRVSRFARMRMLNVELRLQGILRGGVIVDFLMGRASDGTCLND